MILITIIDWNAYQDTKNCILYLENQTYKLFDILVVDNGSTDGSIERIEKEFPYVKIIKNKDNRGFSGGANVGLRYGVKYGYDYVLLLNNDTIFKENLLEVMVRMIETDDKIGAVGILDTDLNLRYIKGSCLMIKTSVIKKVGLLDEKFFVYYEDADYSLRILQKGFKIKFIPDNLINEKQNYSKEYLSRKSYYMARNGLYLFRKHKLYNEFFVFLFYKTIVTLFYSIKIRKFFLFKYSLKGILDYFRGRMGCIS